MSGDEWKGESQPPPISPFLSALMGGLRPTQEELDAAHADMAAACSLGDLTYRTLPRYDESRACVKCGGRKRSVGYVERAPVPTLASAVGSHDFLSVACKRCRYAWIERPLDDGEEARKP